MLNFFYYLKPSYIKAKLHPYLLLLFSFGSNICYGLEINQDMPHFELKNLITGETMSNAQVRDKIVYIDFWATWCSSCLEGLPKLDKLNKKFSPEYFQIITINLNSDVYEAQQFYKKQALDLPVLIDPLNKTIASFNLTGIPTGFLFDANGKLVISHSGYDQNFLEVLDKEIKQQINLIGVRD